MKRLLLYFAISLLPLFAFADDNHYSAKDFFIECSIDNESLYEHEPAIVTLTLYSPTADISGVSKSSGLTLDHGEFASISSVQVMERGSKVKVKGKEYYAFPISQYLISVADNGKYTLKSGELSVRVAYPVVVRDPFWGNIRSSQTETYRVPVNDKSFKVKDLPKQSNNSFSGAIGSFTVKTIIPPGNIIVNQEATAVVQIDGYGYIPDQTLPEYRSAFKGNVQLKSISESRQQYIKNGKAATQLVLNCTFIPKQKNDAEIGEISFEFFNPKTGNYETVKSVPVQVEAKSSTILHQTIDI